MSLISIVVPCYNEASVIEHFVARLSAVTQDAANRFSVSFEIVFVDDGSGDGTSERLREVNLPADSRAIVFSRNFGKEAALTAGLDMAAGEAVILMDADLQHPPERIFDLIEHWHSGYDVVYFYKSNRADEGRGRGTISKVFYGLVNFGARFKIPPDAGDFRLMDRRVVDAIRQLPERERFMKGLYGWVGFKQIGLPFDVPNRHGDQGSRFPSSRLFALALDGVTSFSIAPVRLISLFGFLILGLSLIYMAWLILERLLIGSPFSGFTSIVVLITFFGGVQLVCLGIIGEYVGKSLLEAKRRPSYIVRETFVLSSVDTTAEVQATAQLKNSDVHKQI